MDIYNLFLYFVLLIVLNFDPRRENYSHSLTSEISYYYKTYKYQLSMLL